VLGYSAARAAYRELQHDVDWEKTDHVGAHRRPVTSGASPRITRPIGWVHRPSVRDAWRTGMVHGRSLLVRALTISVFAMAFLGRALAAAGHAVTASVMRVGRELPARPSAPEPVTGPAPGASELAFAAAIRATFHVSAELPGDEQQRSIPESVGIGPRGCPSCGRTTTLAVNFCRRCGSRMRPIVGPAIGTATRTATGTAPSRPVPTLLSPRKQLRALFASLVLGLIMVLSVFEIILAQAQEPSSQADRPAAQRAAPDMDHGTRATRQAAR